HYYMRARHYDPTIGRFLSEDPIWSTNLYPYCDNNPIMGIDPRGEAGLDAVNVGLNGFFASKLGGSAAGGSVAGGSKGWGYFFGGSVGALGGGIAGAAAAGAMFGATVGSTFPVAGTIVGAALGGLVGVGFAYWGSSVYDEQSKPKHQLNSSGLYYDF
ncbi:MAG: hypothetical protein IJ614_08520, partial [Prevotella sp.]|nr:hypothetical protein [Prevotella sp.]